MKKIIALITTFSVLTVVLLHSCKKVSNDIAINKPPVANAGADQVLILPKDSVMLNGTNSYDPEKAIMIYRWTKIAGPESYVIRNASSVNTVVAALVSGVYRFELKVTDKGAAVDRDTVQITVKTGNGNYPPVADAGSDQIIALPLNSCTLNGTGSYDPDGTVATYQWTKIGGPASFTLVNSNASTAQVTNMVEGNYIFELKVTDNIGLTGKDTVHMLVVKGPAECNITGIPQLNGTLNQMGTLSHAQTPYIAACGNKIIIGGGSHGYGGIDIYDVNNHEWSHAELSNPRTNMAIVSCGNKVFFAGGNNGDRWYDIVDIYDVNDGSWSVKHLSTSKSFLTGGSVSDKVFFAGGITDEGWDQTGLIEIYDISEGSWSWAHLSEAKFNVGIVTAGNKIYFAGGVNYMGGMSDKTVDIYDASANSWSTTHFNEIGGDVSGVAYNDKIYWAGKTVSGTDSKVEIWDIKTGSVTTSCLSYPRTHPTAVVKNNNILFFNTSSIGALPYDVSNQFDIYNSLTGERSVGYLNQSVGGAAVISFNNVVYMAGGTTSSSNKVYTVDW